MQKEIYIWDEEGAYTLTCIQTVFLDFFVPGLFAGYYYLRQKKINKKDIIEKG